MSQGSVFPASIVGDGVVCSSGAASMIAGKLRKDGREVNRIGRADGRARPRRYSSDFSYTL
jgi:hypothetical protein